MKGEEKLFWRVNGEQLKELRRGEGLTQERLAKMISKSRTSVSNIEMGRQRITLYDAVRILDLLGYTFTIKRKKER